MAILRGFMKLRLADTLLALSRRVQFKGKATLLDHIGIGPSNRNIAPADVGVLECADGIRMRTTRPTDIMFRELYVNGLYQDDVLAALGALVRPETVFWDIGANYGFMSIWVHRHLEGRVQITAFEPNPVVLRELSGNLTLNGCSDVRLEELCLSDSEGEVTFFTSEDQSWNATLIASFASEHGESVEVRVRSTTIDRYLLGHPEPKVMKLDVEGAEHLVIAGGRDFLRRSDVAVVAEYNESSIAAAGLSGEEYLGLFRELGFRIEMLERPTFGRYRWERRFTIESANQLPHLCNLVFTKP